MLFDDGLFNLYLKETKKEKVNIHLNTGDIFDGWYQNRPSSIFEQNAVGFDNQMKLAIEKFSKLDAPLYFITGNHSYNTFVRGAGVEAGIYLEDKLNQLGHEAHFLGNAEGDVVFNNSKIKLLHPDGGTAYALSYRPQKIIESISGGEKPEVLLIGHFHKIEQLFYRNVHCFDGSTKITTNKGNVPIRQIKKGDKVLTHKGRFRKVVQLHNRKCDGNFVKILFRNKDEKTQQINSTPEHPILVIRNKIKQWVKAKEVLETDFILVNWIECKYCKKHLPYWRVSCNECISKLKHKNKSEYKNFAKGNEHYKKDILPRAKELQQQGYKVCPIGDVIPDIIAYKDGKLIAIEIENKWIKKGKDTKYDGFDFVDEVRWEIINKGKPFADYEIDEESGFVIVPVEKTIHFKKRNTKVYNIGVEEDNTYVASNVVVHNCFQTGTLCGQTKFMRGKNIPAHKAFWILDVYSNKNGGVDKIKTQLYTAYD
jgi:Holliday junction resolvase